jgi:hypothetical protein
MTTIAAPIAEQYDLFEAPPAATIAPRWILTRPMAASRLRAHALAKLDEVRRHFPELDGVTVRVGRTTSRRARAWASLDPADPAIWIKPGSLPRFTIAHELTHLLQARGLAPRGEKPADLYALARHPDVIDRPPTYLAVPRLLFGVDGDPRPGTAELLHDTARRIIAEETGRPRRAVRRFEEAVALAAVPSALTVLDRLGLGWLRGDRRG